MNKFLVKKYVKKLKDKTIQCTVCPNNCIITNGNYGVCRVRKNISGKLYSTVYGYPVGLHIDPIEKKPLYHFHPGSSILSFGTYGCNMSCKGCQNFDITNVSAIESEEKIKHLEYYTPKDIIDLAIENNIQMIAYTYNEPTIFFEYMIDIAKLAKSKGIKNVLVSNGYINPEPLKELCRYIDAANIDIKGITEKFYPEYARAKLAPVLNTIKTIHNYKNINEKHIWLELTNLLIPGLNDSEKDITELSNWIIKNIGTNVPIHFSKFYPYHHAKDIPQTNSNIVLKAKSIAKKSGIKYVYTGNIGLQENTVCNNCNNIIIRREIGANKLRPRIANNRCIYCNENISGIFTYDTK